MSGGRAERGAGASGGAGGARMIAGSRVVDTAAAEWRAFDEAPGVTYKVLSKSESGSLTLLLKFEPGSSYPTHTHPKGEEYFVLSGTLEDLGESFGPGAYIHHPPGSTHTPRSERGCEVLIFLPAGVELRGPRGGRGYGA
jgi:anti-sigma factor ChrR (cupin superfamily)